MEDNIIRVLRRKKWTGEQWNGRGVVSVSSKNIEICPTCKGSGREKGGNLSCLKCGGKGVVAR